MASGKLLINKLILKKMKKFEDLANVKKKKVLWSDEKIFGLGTTFVRKTTLFMILRTAVQ